MSDQQFDELAKKLAKPISRRQAFKAFMGAALAGMFGVPAAETASAQGSGWFDGPLANEKVVCNDWCDHAFEHSSPSWQECINEAYNEIQAGVTPGEGNSLCLGPCGPYGSDCLGCQGAFCGPCLCGTRRNGVFASFDEVVCCHNGYDCLNGSCCLESHICSPGPNGPWSCVDFVVPENPECCSDRDCNTDEIPHATAVGCDQGDCVALACETGYGLDGNGGCQLCGQGATGPGCTCPAPNPSTFSKIKPAASGPVSCVGAGHYCCVTPEGPNEGNVQCITAFNPSTGGHQCCVDADCPNGQMCTNGTCGLFCTNPGNDGHFPNCNANGSTGPGENGTCICGKTYDTQQNVCFLNGPSGNANGTQCRDTCGQCLPGQYCIADNNCSSGRFCANPCTCASGQTLCNGACVNFNTDVHNCGSCGNACGINADTCTNGTCTCGTGAACPTGVPCINGHCAMVCTGGTAGPTYPNCNANGSTGTADVAGNCVCGFLGPSGTTGVCFVSPATLSCVANCADCAAGTLCIQDPNACPAGSPFICAPPCSPCSTGQTLCNGVCVNLSTDNNNCGTCGTKCTGNTTCQNGTCVTGCTNGTTAPPFNDCGSTGTGGTCVCGLPPGVTDPTKGVCFSNNQPGNCTSDCSTCPAGMVCVQDTGTGTNGCGNFGGFFCGDPCSVGCPAGQALCNAVCTDITTSPNCGACGVTCTAPATCQKVGGVYTCAATCPAAGVCNGGSSTTTPGGYSAQCGSDPTAPDGTCFCVTEAEGTFCVQNWHANQCVSSCTACDPTKGEICVTDTGPGCACNGNGGHVCVKACGQPCAPNQVYCPNDTNTGMCVNLQTDPNNCGSCGHVCPSNTPTCSAGVCTANVCPAAGTCNGGTVSGYSPVCGHDTAAPGGTCYCVIPQGQTTTQCVRNWDATSCVSSCTGCNGVCFADTGPGCLCTTHGGFACVQVCNATCTGKGQMLCNGVCVNTLTDNNNCGACGTKCTAGTTCVNGTCAPTCAPGQTCASGYCATTPGGHCFCVALADGGATFVTDGSNADPAICPGGGCNCPTCTTSSDCPSGYACLTGANPCCTNNNICRPMCAAGTVTQGLCNGVCTDLTTTTNCGTCGTVCAAGQTCLNGTCVQPCSPGQTCELNGTNWTPIAPGSNCFCVVSSDGKSYLATSGPNGPTCNATTPCPAGQICVFGSTTPGATTDCFGNPVGVCRPPCTGPAGPTCNPTCPTGATCTASNTCAYTCTNGSPTEVTAPQCNNPNNKDPNCFCVVGAGTGLEGTQVCVRGGVCATTSCADCTGANPICYHISTSDCPSGFGCSHACPVCPTTTPTLCPSGCVDLTSDAANCGACGHACATGQSCVNSTCVYMCSNGTPAETTSPPCTQTNPNAPATNCVCVVGAGAIEGKQVCVLNGTCANTGCTDCTGATPVCYHIGPQCASGFGCSSYCTTTGGTGTCNPACTAGQVCENSACFNTCTATANNASFPACGAANSGCVCAFDTANNQVCVQARAACPTGVGTDTYCTTSADCATGDVCVPNPNCTGGPGVCNAPCGSCPPGFTIVNGLCTGCTPPCTTGQVCENTACFNTCTATAGNASFPPCGAANSGCVCAFDTAKNQVCVQARAACPTGIGSDKYCASDADCAAGDVCVPNPNCTGGPGVCNAPCGKCPPGFTLTNGTCTATSGTGTCNPACTAGTSCVNGTCQPVCSGPNSANTCGNNGSPCSPPSAPNGIPCVCVNDTSGGGNAFCGARVACATAIPCDTDTDCVTGPIPAAFGQSGTTGFCSPASATSGAVCCAPKAKTGGGTFAGYCVPFCTSLAATTCPAGQTACGNLCCGTGETCDPATGMCACGATTSGTGPACGTGTACLNGTCAATCTATGGNITTNTCTGPNQSCSTAPDGASCFCLADKSGANFCGAAVACPGTTNGSIACTSDADCTSVPDLNGNKGPGFCSTAICCGAGHTLSPGICVPLCASVGQTTCGTGPACTAGQTCCGTGLTATCANLQTDPANCGSCGHACGTGETCVAGVCMCGSVATCGPGTACVNGACEGTCTGTFQNNTCGGRSTCGTTGMTVNNIQCLCLNDNSSTTTTMTAYCGTLIDANATPCNSDAQCTGNVPGAFGQSGPGFCAGPANATDGTICLAAKPGFTGYCVPFCNAVAPTTCTAGQTACGSTCCTAGETCDAATGTCHCGTGPACTGGTVCCGTGANATCVNTQTSAANCGACGTACGPGEICTGGVCKCGTNPPCTVAGTACVNGTCAATCPAGAQHAHNTCTGVTPCVGNPTANGIQCLCIADNTTSANFCGARVDCATAVACNTDADCATSVGTGGNTGPGFCAPANSTVGSNNGAVCCNPTANFSGYCVPICLSVTATTCPTGHTPCGTSCCGLGEACDATTGTCHCGAGPACAANHACLNGTCQTTCTGANSSNTCLGGNSCGMTQNGTGCTCVQGVTGANFCASNVTCTGPNAVVPCTTDADCLVVTDANGATGPGFCSTAIGCPAGCTTPGGSFCAPLCGSVSKTCPAGQAVCGTICCNPGETCTAGVCHCNGGTACSAGQVCEPSGCVNSCGVGQTCQGGYTSAGGGTCVSNAEGGTTRGVCAGSFTAGGICFSCTASTDCTAFNSGSAVYFCQTNTSCGAAGCSASNNVCVQLLQYCPLTQTCVNTQLDFLNCGSCGNQCDQATTNECLNGTCVCGGAPACTGGTTCQSDGSNNTFVCAHTCTNPNPGTFPQGTCPATCFCVVGFDGTQECVHGGTCATTTGTCADCAPGQVCYQSSNCTTGNPGSTNIACANPC